METLIAATLLLAQSEALSQSSPEQTTPTPIEVPVENTQPEPDNLEAPLVCGPNQFPSAFVDVYPTDWAYQAVNRLASKPAECFDYPPERSPAN